MRKLSLEVVRFEIDHVLCRINHFAQTHAPTRFFSLHALSAPFELHSRELGSSLHSFASRHRSPLTHSFFVFLHLPFSLFFMFQRLNRCCNSKDTSFAPL
ncbi:hypothetical protein VNO80_22532 [Phaseolus coccineus]|uniref:Uncharacterized protein n=1 Tax=Phaseolus coccineus TaxID=3886 RepID=A0AAN9M513_PHACN